MFHLFALILRRWKFVGVFLSVMAVADGAPLKIPGYEAVQMQVGGMNRLAFPATLAGKPITFLLDTGAALSSIDRESVAKWKLHAPARNLGIAAQKTMNGRKADVVWLPDFRSGAVNFGSVPMTVLPSGNYFQDFPAKNGVLHGLFGSDLLRLYEAVVICQTAQVFFKMDPKVHVDLAKELVPLGYVGIPLQQRNGVYYVPCKLKKFSFLMMVDTGAFVTIFRKKKIDLFGIRSQETEMSQHALNGSSTKVLRVLPEDHRLSIGGLPIAFPVGATNDPLLERTSEFDELGILGGDMLGLHGAIIDYATLTLYLRPPRATKN